MDDMNLVVLEGTVVFTPDVVAKDDKKAINFLVENVRKSAKNSDMRFRYNCVAWSPLIDRVGDKLVEGAFVRVTGHLQDNVLHLPDDKTFHYCKVCADRIDF